jgi:hypothetical protein
MRPKVPTDLSLAPVAAEIDLNLQSLRNDSLEDVFDDLALALNLGAPGTSRDARAEAGGRGVRRTPHRADPLVPEHRHGQVRLGLVVDDRHAHELFHGTRA